MTDDFIFSAVNGFAHKAAEKDSKKPKPEIPAASAIRMKNTQNDRFSVGFASKDITPGDLDKHTYWMAGYNIAKSIKGFLDPLTINAMWIDCNDGQGIVLVSCDLIGLTGYEIKEIRGCLVPFCRKTGCRHITVSCTHTHAGIDTMGYWGVLPKSGKDKHFMETVKDTVVRLCFEAYQNRKSGKMFFGTADTPELLHRWRQPYFSKATLSRFRFVPDDGSEETWYLNFPAHPNTLGGKNRLLSADYPCYMRREINRIKKTNVMYSISAIGATDIGEISESAFERALVGGAKLGRKAAEITDERQLAPEMTVISQNFIMPIDNPVLTAANALKVFNARRCSADSDTGIGFISEITYIGIGGVQILTMPGEMFPELVWKGGYCDAATSATGDGAEINPVPLSEVFDDDGLIIFGVTNDMAGYAIAPNDFILDEKRPFLDRGKDRFGRNHYHETNSCGVNTGRVIEQTCRLIKNTLDSTAKEE